MCPTNNFSILTMLQKCRETALQWHLHLLKSAGIQESLLFHIGGARMSQEVSKRLVNPFANHLLTCWDIQVGPHFSRNFGASSHFSHLCGEVQYSVSLDSQEQNKIGQCEFIKIYNIQKIRNWYFWACSALVGGFNLFGKFLVKLDHFPR